MDWNENEHFVRVFMKMSVLKPKTGSINSGTGSDKVPIRDCSIESPSTCIFSTASKFFPGLVFLYSVETIFPNSYLFHTQ